MSISPQGYLMGDDPKSQNPFWGEGEDSDVNKIYATASVDDGTGVPSVTTSKKISGHDITFGFDFHNLKGPQGTAGQGVPSGGTTGQVLTKKSGTDYDTEWKDPTGGTAYGRISFGGKSGFDYEPRLEEDLYKTYGDYSRTINESASVTYFFNNEPVDDTININGVLNIPAGTLMERTLSYFIGGYTVVNSNVESVTMTLNPSDFTITLSSGNTIEITSLSIGNIGSSSPSSEESALISIYFNVSNGTDTTFGGTTINIGKLNISGNHDLNTYFLEPKK